MVVIESGIAKYHCLYTQGVVASQRSGIFDSSGIFYTRGVAEKDSLT